MFRPLAATCAQSTSASPASVWAALQAAPRWPEVLHDLVEARIRPDGVLAAGAEIATRARPGTAAVDMTYRVLAAEPPRRLVLASETREARSRTEYTIEAAATGGALVTLVSRVELVRWLHRVSTAFVRTPHERFLVAALQTRNRALLALAEELQGSGAAPGR